MRSGSASAKFTDALIGIKPIRAMGRAEQFADCSRTRPATSPAARDCASSAPEYSADLQEPVIGAVLAIGFYLAVTKLSLEVHDLLIMSVLMSGPSPPCCRCSAMPSGSSRPTINTVR